MDTISVVYQRWEESERGWGIRPDGFSLHVSMEACKQYIDLYHSSLPDTHVPDSYERTVGEPEWVEVPAEFFNRHMRDKNDNWRFGANILPITLHDWLMQNIRDDLLAEVATIEKELASNRGEDDE